MKEKLIELITAITKRPAMYGVNKVEDIDLIILGYITCSAVVQGNALDFNTEFRNYVNKDFEMKGDHAWPRLIRFIQLTTRIPSNYFQNCFSST
jgi:hypothetical protein